MKHTLSALLSSVTLLSAAACAPVDGDPLAAATQALGEGGATRLAAGVGHTCAIRANGTVACWGSNSHVLGAGNRPNATGYIGAPQDVPGLTDVTRIASTYMTTVAVHADGHVSCWGNDASGQCGTGTTGLRWTPVTMSGVTDAVDAAAGSYHTCVVHAGGGLSCVGYNSHGQLGDGTTTSRTTRVSVNIPGGAARVWAAAQHTCALNGAGQLYCFGRNDDAQAGVNGGWAVTSPTLVPVPGAVIALTLGYSHTCAVTSGGGVYCWGTNYYGQLGVGQSTPYLAQPYQPRAVPINDAVGAAGGGYGQHACVVRAGGAVACWGFNSYGQLGDGTWGASVKRTSPVAMLNVSDAQEVLVGAYHTCVRRTDGSVACAGGNGNGQLGNGTASTQGTALVGTVTGLNLNP
ncbi:MAG: hypothetical protein U0325_33550 [Polyangiales bacterium]